MRFSTIATAAFAASVGAQDDSDSSMSICDKYTTALLMNNTSANQQALVTLLVKTAVIGNFTGPGTMNAALPGSMNEVPGILAKATFMGEQVNLAPYFTGALASSNRNNMPVAINFLDGGPTSDLVSMPMYAGASGSMQATLFGHLVQYFGALLKCSTYGQGAFTYGGVKNQYNVHKYMDLSEAEFSYFISQVGAAAQSFGASMSDITAVANSLNTTFGYRCAAPVAVLPNEMAENQVMCQGASCPLASSPVSGCSGNQAVAGVVATSPAAGTATNMAVTATTGTAGMMATTGAAASSMMAAAASSSMAAAGSSAGPAQHVGALEVGLIAAGGIAALGAILL